MLGSDGRLAIFRSGVDGEQAFAALALMERELRRLRLARSIMWLKDAAPAPSAAVVRRAKVRIGYMPRFLASTTLPHRQVKGGQYTRVDGSFKLTLTSPKDFGLPYGVYGRLVLLHLTTAARLTKSRRIRLGTSMRKWLAVVGVSPEGGARGGLTRWMDQVRRVMGTTFHYRDTRNRAGVTFTIVDQWSVTPDGVVVQLGERFYRFAKTAAPVDLDIVNRLRPSSLAIDVYTWLTVRLYTLRRNTVVDWADLRSQFGSAYTAEREFRRRVRAALARVRQAWPDMPAQAVPGGVKLLLGSGPSVRRAPTKLY